MSLSCLNRTEFGVKYSLLLLDRQQGRALVLDFFSQLKKSPYKFLRVFRSGDVLQDFFPEVAEFFFVDSAACAE